MCCHKFVPVLLACFVLPMQGGGLYGDEKCETYHEERVAYLLGCCGDLGIDYPGPFFPGNLDDRHRATLAIEEAGGALKQCKDKESPEYLSLTLDMAGAYLMRADATMYAANNHTRAESIRTASSDSASALRILLDFERKHPSESFPVWKWVATALSRAGSPWEALQFLIGLPIADAEKGERSRYEGDLLFRLGMRGAAANAYGEWLSSRNVNQCAENSFAIAAILENSGFRSLHYKRSENVLCDPPTDWFSYYIRLGPADNPRK